MIKKLSIMFVMILSSSILLASGLPEARAANTTEKLLDILRSRGNITEKEYKELKRTAREEKSRGFETYFDKRLHIDSKDGRFKLQIGGRILIDAAAVNADDGFDAAEDITGETFEGTGVEFRQTRLHITGLLYNRIAFKNEFDFAGGDVTLMENWIELRKMPYLGRIRIGHTKEPFSLERLNSRMYMQFMERALPDGIVPGRNTGIRFLNFIDHPRMSWSVGFFKETGGNGEDFTENGDYNITGRLTVTPWYADDGRNVLHLGVGCSHKFTNEDEEKTWLRFRKRPELHISDLRPVDTGKIPTDGADMIGPEAALVLGPFCLQGEYWYTRLDSEIYNDPELSGYYAACSYFLTGEHRKYKLRGNDGAEFSLVDIKSPLDPEQGKWGAWQVAGRYAAVDLNDNALKGGKTDSITLALNWYPYTNVRWSFNYVHINIEDSYAAAGIEDADADVYQTRFQIYF